MIVHAYKLCLGITFDLKKIKYFSIFMIIFF